LFIYFCQLFRAKQSRSSYQAWRKTNLFHRNFAQP